MEKIIYKTDSKGKVRYLKITAVEGTLTQESGIIGGNPVYHVNVCSPKNIGRSNATTSAEQAELELQSKIAIKLREGYSDSVTEATATEILLPMLAKSYKDEVDKIDWNTAYCQPKLDGMRCLATPDKKISRKNVLIDTVDHIKINVPKFTELVADGELYAHGLNFQENMRIIKKYREGLTEHVKYHIYDTVSELPFIDRYTLAQIIVEGSTHCELVPTFKINNEHEMKVYHQQFIEQGYEGTIIRWGEEGYQIDKRSSFLLKYKDFLDESYKIVDVIPSEKNPKQGQFICEGRTKDGQVFQFGCGMKYSHADREEILTFAFNYIGLIAEIRFFEYSENGIPRFPVCVGTRIDK